MEGGVLQAVSSRRRPREAPGQAEHLSQQHFYSLQTQPQSPLDQWQGFQELIKQPVSVLAQLRCSRLHGMWSLLREAARCIRHKDEVQGCGKEVSWSEEEEDGNRDEGSSSVGEPLLTQGCILTAAIICIVFPC